MTWWGLGCLGSGIALLVWAATAKEDADLTNIPRMFVGFVGGALLLLAGAVIAIIALVSR
jgi:hypothetical protein